MARINDKEVNLVSSKNLELNKVVNGIEGDGSTFSMSEPVARGKFNERVDDYVDRLESHERLLRQYTEEVLKDIDLLLIIPLYEGILIKPYAENPFQRIHREGVIITDLGGLKPVYKSAEDGTFHEEESFICVGLVVEVGPSSRYIREGDVVFWRKPSETPVPFFKQNLVLVNEHSIMAAVNQGLSKRFEEVSNEL